jgi:hypothetical protein
MKVPETSSSHNFHKNHPNQVGNMFLEFLYKTLGCGHILKFYK